MPAGKKPWQKPELVVLVRSRPEEAVLNACKGQRGFVGPVTQFFSCIEQRRCAVRCQVNTAS